MEYLAGLIDGDGCISLYRRPDKKATRGYTYIPYMNITAKDLWFLKELQKRYGGYIDNRTNKRKSGYENSQGTSSLRWNATEMRQMLPKLIPHLIAKKEEATVLNEALQLTKEHRKRNITYDILLDRKVEIMKLLKLNRKMMEA